MLLGAVLYGCLARGAFFGTEFAVFAGLVVVASVCALLLWGPRVFPTPILVAALVCVGGLGLAGGVKGTPGDIAGSVGLVLVAVASLGVARGAPDEVRTLLVGGILLIAGVAALFGLIGVVFRVDAWTQHVQGLWRAASTLTYANASAALLALGSLAGIAMLTGDRRAPLVAGTTTVLLCGLTATVSRAGFLAFGAGYVVLAVMLGWRPTCRVGLALVPAAAIGCAGLLPAIAIGRTWTTPLAISGLVVAVAIAAAAVPILTDPDRRGAFRISVMFAGAGVVAFAGMILLPPAGRDLVTARFGAESENRFATWTAAWDEWVDSPIFGKGRRNVELVLVDSEKGVRRARFAHNEYLQVLAEYGVVGLFGVLAFLATTAWMVYRPATRSPPAGPVTWMHATAAASLAAFVVASGFDFVWHLAVIPVVAFTLVGVGMDHVEPIAPGRRG